jgi:hypothetical protein
MKQRCKERRKDLTQRSQRKSTLRLRSGQAEDTASAKDAEKREIVTVIEELADISPRSLHSAAGAPKGGAEEKAGRSGRDDRIGKEQRNPRARVQNRHVGHPAAERTQRMLAGWKPALRLRGSYSICFFRSERRFRASRGFRLSRSALRSFSRTARSRVVKRTAWLPLL